MGQDDPDAGSLSRTSGDRRGIWGKSGACTHVDARQDVAGNARRKGNLQECPQPSGGDALPLAGNRITVAAEGFGGRGKRAGRPRRDTRGEASQAPGVGCSISPGVDSYAERKGDSAKLS